MDESPAASSATLSVFEVKREGVGERGGQRGGGCREAFSVSMEALSRRRAETADSD